jgi:type VI protein secretion system component VasF
MDDEQLAKHLDAIRSPGGVNPKWKGTADVMHAFAAFLAEIEEEHAKSAAKLERQTDKLIRLTWALVALTVGLLLLTLYLGYDTYLKEQAMRRQAQHATGSAR